LIIFGQEAKEQEEEEEKVEVEARYNECVAVCCSVLQCV